MDRINEVTRDCFNALVQIRGLPEEGLLAPENFHARMTAFLDELFANGTRAGLTDRDVQDIAYAMVALADEVALRKPGGIREVWMSNPLQLRYFNENLAGEGFFQRLDYLLADPHRTEALRVYYLCLLFGFQGRYAVRGGELELAAVQRRAKDALGIPSRPDPLSRHHLRPRERLNRTARGHLSLWLGLLAVLFSLALIIVLNRALNGQTTQLLERIAALLPE